MNKLTKYINDLISVNDYRGENLYQQNRLTDNIDFLVALLTFIKDFDHGMPSKCHNIEMINMVNKLDGFNGVSCDAIRKNVFPDLEKMGFVGRIGKGRNWDNVSITNYGIDFLNKLNNNDRKISIESAHRRYRDENKSMSEFIDRLTTLTDIFGDVFWWEVWMSMRLDVNFTIILDKIRGIRKEFKLKKNIHRGIDSVTKLFLEHNKKGIKRNGVINFDNIINKVTSFGTKATFFFFSVRGKGKNFIIKGQFDTSTTKAKRNYKREPFYVIDGNDKGLEYHHIVPFENVHYNLKLHEKIDGRDNLIPITPTDHVKFPRVDNPYMLIKIVNNKVRFYSVSDEKDYLEIDNDKHLNINLIRKHMIDYNKKLVSFIF